MLTAIINNFKYIKNNRKFIFRILFSNSNSLKTNKNIFYKSYFEGDESNYDNWPVPSEFIEKKILIPRIEIIKKYCKNLKSKRIIDLGCSNGSFLKICDYFGLKTYGIDISKFAISEAKKNTKAQLYRSNLNKGLKYFKDGQFNIACAFDVVEHIPHKKLFNEVYRTLNKGGIFYIVTPNGIQKSDFDKTHINLHKISEWIKFLEESRFKILESYTYRWYPPIPYLLVQKILNIYNHIRGFYIEQVVIVCKK